MVRSQVYRTALKGLPEGTVRAGLARRNELSIRLFRRMLRLMNRNPWQVLFLGLAVFLLGGCSAVSTGARSAYVLVLRDGTPVAASTTSISSTQLKPLLSEHFLWQTDDRRAAKYIAVVEISPAEDAIRPAALRLVRTERNLSWNPAAVSSPWPVRESAMHPSLQMMDSVQRYDSSFSSNR
jgi:hypothetical protein